ncbi:hypothetical protein Zmor_018749 [Zophobas morio]|uniref:Sm domain-containing protein n=1 Tax=Zophobas morio TaxID=2755281 RepID=A0AA38ICX6_9CUCU|nr:hypothetical protein Zmor_018749 [Zophobas morio]
MASGLDSFVNHTVSIITSDGRNFIGTLKGFDQTINIIIDESHERVYSTTSGVEQVMLGLHIIRGDNVNFDALKGYDDKILTSKDDGGRSVLHLICSWGQRHPRLRVTSSKIDRNLFSHFTSVLVNKISFLSKIPTVRYTVDDPEFPATSLETEEYLDAVLHLISKCSIAEPDGLFKLTPFSYAQVSESLGAELELLQSEMLQTEQLYSDCDRINILYYSSMFGYEKAIKTVVTKKLTTYYDEVNFSCKRLDDTALTIASGKGHTAVVEYLLQLGTEINRANKNGVTPLHEASSNGHVKIVECLVKCGAEVNHATNSGWVFGSVNFRFTSNSIPSSIRSSPQNLELHETYRSKLNRAYNSFSWTPLYTASVNGHEKIVEFLVKYGAEINRTDRDGNAPLYAASMEGHEKIVEFLVKCGANVNGLNDYGETPLYAACLEGHEKIVERLVKGGAAINHCNSDGETPLYIASLSGHEKVVECLVIGGAEINRTNRLGQTPLYIASRLRHEKIVTYLKANGGKLT